MSERRAPISRHVADQAADWFARQDDRGLDAEEEGQLQAWRDADPEHERAWQRLNQLWQSLDDTPASFRDSARGRAGAWRIRRRRRAVAGGVTTIALLLGIAEMTALPTRLRADFMTETGERRTVTLADGSIVQLNTASAIAVDYEGAERRVRLLEGEAVFRVAPVSGRPFVVEAQGGTATARGTAYIVRRLGDDTQVTVTEHVVAVAAPHTSTVNVGEGQRVRYGPNGVGPIVAVDSRGASAWLRGKLVFENRPLGEVVEEIGRYHPGYIRVVDAEAARMRISGVFPTDDPVAAIDDIERSFHLRSIRISNRLILIRR